MAASLMKEKTISEHCCGLGVILLKCMEKQQFNVVINARVTGQFKNR
jgi:hypothetical protein